MRAMAWLVGVVLTTAAVALPAVATADGCYICSQGSSDACRDYCRYTGDDTWDNRHACERRGCRIGGTASCPQAVNYNVCSRPRPAPETAACYPPAVTATTCGG